MYKELNPVQICQQHCYQHKCSGKTSVCSVWLDKLKWRQHSFFLSQSAHSISTSVKVNSWLHLTLEIGVNTTKHIYCTEADVYWFGGRRQRYVASFWKVRTLQNSFHISTRIWWSSTSCIRAYRFFKLVTVHFRMSLGRELGKYWVLKISFENLIQKVSVCSGPKNKSDQFGGCFFLLMKRKDVLWVSAQITSCYSLHEKNTTKTFSSLSSLCLIVLYLFSSISSLVPAHIKLQDYLFYVYCKQSHFCLSSFPSNFPAISFLFSLFISSLSPSLSLLVFPQSSQSLQQWNKCTALTWCWLSVRNNAITVFTSVTISPVLAWALWMTRVFTAAHPSTPVGTPQTVRTWHVMTVVQSVMLQISHGKSCFTH